MAFQWEQFDRLLLYSVIHLISCAIALICDCSTATYYRRRRFVCYENHVFVAFIQLNARCTAMKWSNVECKCENYEYFINNHSPIYRYQFDCIAPLTTLIKENWLYRRRAPRIESITSNAMIYTWSYLIDLSRIIFFPLLSSWFLLRPIMKWIDLRCTVMTGLTDRVRFYLIYSC